MLFVGTCTRFMGARIQAVARCGDLTREFTLQTPFRSVRRGDRVEIELRAIWDLEGARIVGAQRGRGWGPR